MSMMSAKNLRNSILQMAVEGKLVEQRDEEGSAADLLASIREQRAQLVREKKAKPIKGGESVIWRDDAGHWFERRGKGEAVCIDEEVPFDIPDSWCWARMRDVLTFVNGRAYKKSELLPVGKYPVLRVGNLFTNSSWYYSDLELEPEKYCHNGDLLYAWSASFGPALWHGGTCIFHYHIWKIKHNNQLLREYLYWYLLEDVNRIRNYTTGSAMIHVSMEHMMPRLLPIPPFAEQKRIVSKIDELMPHVDKYGKARERREQLDRELPVKLRKSILQAAVEGKLTEQSDDEEPASVLLAGIREQRAQLVREKKAKPVKGGESVIYRDDSGHWFERRGKGDPVCIDEEIPFDIPNSWCWARMEAISNFGACLNIEYNDVAEGTWNLDLEDIKKDSGIVLRKKCKCNDEQASTKHVFAEGMVLYSKLRPYLNKVIVADENGVCSSEILPIQFEGLDARYAQVFLMSPYFLSFANAHVSGTKMPRLRVADGKQCLIPVPPLAEQECIGEKVNAVLGFVDTIN